MKFQAWFTAMTGDRHDELATMYLRMIAVRGSESMDCKTWCTSFVIFFIIAFWFCFGFEQNHTYHTSVSCDRILLQ